MPASGSSSDRRPRRAIGGGALRAAVFLALAAHAAPAAATEPIDEGIEDVYLAPEAFLADAFGGAAPKARKFWIKREHRAVIDEILGHGLGALRVSYWRAGLRTAWILEEIGKVKPITTGFVVEDGAIARIRVLVYRESRGWEVRHDFFTAQFEGARLEDGLRLDRRIDGISGATLSVRALTRLARLALWLHAAATEDS